MEKNNTLDKLNNMLEAKKAEEKPRKVNLNGINDDVQVMLEYAKAMSDYIERINDNQTVANREMIKSDYLGNEMGKIETAVVMLNKYLDQAIELLEGK